MINVGVDVWDYAPVSADVLEELIRGHLRYGRPAVQARDRASVWRV
jgi:hypothetical protein